MNITLYLLCFIIMMASCSSNRTENSMKETSINQKAITKKTFGTLPDGKEVFLYTLKNNRGMTMKVINYGGIITSLTAPDKNGKFEDVVLGFDSLEGYLNNTPYFGALIGRYGNRIAKGKFSIDDQHYTLATNNMGNHLHGGIKGFDKVYWEIQELQQEQGAALKLTYTSPDMEEGYPGNLNVEVIYTLTDSNELKIEYKATTDKKTIVNLTQHSYFNLSGNTKTSILQHELMINADAFIPVSETLIPEGPVKSVTGTPFDFKTPVVVGARIDKDDLQLKYAGGYDHCWILNKTGNDLTLAATLHDPSSGRVMTVHTTDPGIQFYSGNFLDGTIKGKAGVAYQKRSGLCLETQHFPDTPNQKQFPSVMLNPEEVYQTQTVYTFSVK